MEWSIATCSFGGTLEEKLVAIAKAGFRAVELFEDDLCAYSGRPADLRRFAEDLGLRIVALQPIRNFEAMPEPWRTRNLELAERKFDLMEELGVDLTYVCSNVHPTALDDLDRAAEDLWNLAERAARRGMRVGFEALAWGRHIRDWTQAWEVVRRADHPNLGLVLDSFHLFVRGNPVEPIRQVPGHRIFLVQLADAPAISIDSLLLSRHHRCLPGQGDWPIEAFLQAVLSTGYTGPISLEIFNTWFRSLPPNQIARDGMRALRFTFDQIGLSIPRIPRIPTIEDIGFLELVADDQATKDLEDFLRGLGFQRTAHHPVFNLDLFSQGEIRLVLNREQESPHHAAYAQSCPSVSGVAFTVKRVEPVIARAQQLGADVELVQYGETRLPAIRGVGGSLIYLTESPIPEPLFPEPLQVDQSPAPANLECVDHVTNIVNRPEVTSWILFYKALFGFEVEAVQGDTDPYGASFCHCVRNRRGTVRILINTAEGRNTVVSRFLEVAERPGIQHVAFAATDIWSFVERATAAGFRFLEIPPSYYRVLASRLDLAEEFLERLESYHIMYDRTEDGGEFFHLYTPMLHGKFFFEIVQRRKGYSRFGETNTPVRVVAQAQAYERYPKRQVHEGQEESL